MKTFRELLLSNKAWAREMQERKANFFSDQANGQNPEILWIGCSDSRVSPEQITQTRPGELFIHRNIANIVHGGDENLGSVLQFAVEDLSVRHIVVCGHYDCGGIQATLAGGTDGPIDRWLAGTRTVLDSHRHELDAITDKGQRINRLVELNVRDQLIELSEQRVVREAWASGAELRLHGLVYDLRNGLISELLSFDNAEEAASAAVPDPVLLSD